MPIYSSTQPKQTDTDNNLLAKIAQATTSSVGSSDYTTSNVVVAASSTLVLAARLTRRYAVLKNIETTVVQYIGKSGVTTSTGMELRPGQSVVWETTAAVYAISASGNTNLRVVEFHD